MNLLCMKQPQVVNVELTNNMQLQVIFETVETNWAPRFVIFQIITT